MSMPQIPEEKNRPSLCEVTIDIFKSIALEETALSHILNAEGERSQAILKRLQCNPCSMSYDELEKSVKQTEKLLNSVIMKEWLLLKKLETAYEINQNMSCKPKKEPFDNKKEPCNHCCCNCCCNFHLRPICYNCGRCCR